MLGFNLKDRSAKIWDDGETPFSSTNLATIGQTVVRILLPKHLEETKNKIVYVASHTTTQNQILASFEKITTEKWKTERIDSAPLIEEVTAKIKAGASGPDVIFPIIQASILAGGLGNLADHSAKVWNEKLGLPKEDLGADLKDILDGKKP